MEYQLKLIHKNRKSYNAVLRVIDNSDGITMILDDYTGKPLIKENTFPFVCLCEIRKELEEKGLKIGCKGNRLDVYPSGSMLIGFNAYILKKGERALDVVNLFEEEEDYNLLASVKEQEDYFDQWLNSL